MAITTTDKANYLKQTKSLLKDAINDKGGAITNQTPFREYVDAVEAIETTPEPLNPSSATFWDDFDALLAEGDIDKMKLVLPVGTLIATGKSSYPYVQIAHYGTAELSDGTDVDGVYIISCYTRSLSTKTNTNIVNFLDAADAGSQFPTSITSRAVAIKRPTYISGGAATTLYGTYTHTFFPPTMAEVAGVAGRNQHEEPWELYLQLTAGNLTGGNAIRRLPPGTSSTSSMPLGEAYYSTGTGRRVIQASYGSISYQSSSSVSDGGQEACFIPIGSGL
jgi:hypothetical protein